RELHAPWKQLRNAKVEPVEGITMSHAAIANKGYGSPPRSDSGHADPRTRRPGPSDREAAGMPRPAKQLPTGTCAPGVEKTDARIHRERAVHHPALQLDSPRVALAHVEVAVQLHT